LDLFDAPLETLAELVGGIFECATHFGADTVRVRVGVVERGQLGGEFCAESFREGVGNLGDCVRDAERD
jgi:hypothetical protein